jgi:hypothetical protein
MISRRRGPTFLVSVRNGEKKGTSSPPVVTIAYTVSMNSPMRPAWTSLSFTGSQLSAN